MRTQTRMWSITIKYESWRLTEHNCLSLSPLCLQYNLFIGNFFHGMGHGPDRTPLRSAALALCAQGMRAGGDLGQSLLCVQRSDAFSKVSKLKRMPSICANTLSTQEACVTCTMIAAFVVFIS